MYHARHIGRIADYAALLRAGWTVLGEYEPHSPVIDWGWWLRCPVTCCPEPVTCAGCGRKMPPTGDNGKSRRYCSRACTGRAKRALRACAHCGGTFHGERRRRFCSRPCARAAQPAAIHRRLVAALGLADAEMTLTHDLLMPGER